MNKAELLGRWTKEKSEELYGIKNWGASYFSVSNDGEVLVNPYKDDKSAVSLKEIISGVSERGLDMPVLLRFENILDSQISYLNESFKWKPVRKVSHYERKQLLEVFRQNHFNAIVIQIFTIILLITDAPALVPAIKLPLSKASCMACLIGVPSITSKKRL